MGREKKIWQIRFWTGLKNIHRVPPLPRFFLMRFIRRELPVIITCHQLDEMSGRAYARLKREGIGREAFVLINLPRGGLPVIAIVRVWKAGAGERGSDGPGRRRDHDGKIISESLHRGREIVKKHPKLCPDRV